MAGSMRATGILQAAFEVTEGQVSSLKASAGLLTSALGSSNPHSPRPQTTPVVWSAVSSLEACATPALSAGLIVASRSAGQVSHNP